KRDGRDRSQRRIALGSVAVVFRVRSAGIRGAQGNVEVRVRVTAVLVIERGHWRIAQWHASIAQTNEESFGKAFTTSVDRIERSVRADRPDVRPASAPDGTV